MPNTIPMPAAAHLLRSPRFFVRLAPHTCLGRLREACSWEQAHPASPPRAVLALPALESTGDQSDPQLR